jgi:VWFA-related protein
VARLGTAGLGVPRRLGACPTFLALAGCLWAQEAKFSTGVDLVTLLATVRDSQGLLAKNLGRDDFVLEEDGVPQTIRYFARESDLPLTIGLLVDTSNSQLHVLEPERRASYTFLEQVIREDRDRAFVAHFDFRVEVLQGFSSSRKDLAAALGELKVPSRFGTLLYDAIRDCSENQTRMRMGRKAFILLSDGGDHRSKTSLGTAIEYAQRADTIIYSILFAEPPSPSRPFRSAVLAMDRPRGRKVMRRLAAETGGAFFEVTKEDPIEKIYAAIEETLRNQYSLGYTPEPKGASGRYHKIKLMAKRPGLVVQTREGYYSK